MSSVKIDEDDDCEEKRNHDPQRNRQGDVVSIGGLLTLGTRAIGAAAIVCRAGGTALEEGIQGVQRLLN